MTPAGRSSPFVIPAKAGTPILSGVAEFDADVAHRMVDRSFRSCGA